MQETNIISFYIQIAIYHCYNATSDRYSNELSIINTFHERELCSRSRMNEQSFVSVYRAYSVNTGNILMLICETQYTSGSQTVGRDPQGGARGFKGGRSIFSYR
jgi:hypothetical protein